MMTLTDIVALVAPAIFGVVAAIVLGHRQVRQLRDATGDQSALTRVLAIDIGGRKRLGVTSEAQGPAPDPPERRPRG